MCSPDCFKFAQVEVPSYALTMASNIQFCSPRLLRSLLLHHARKNNRNQRQEKHHHHSFVTPSPACLPPPSHCSASKPIPRRPCLIDPTVLNTTPISNIINTHHENCTVVSIAGCHRNHHQCLCPFVVVGSIKTAHSVCRSVGHGGGRHGQQSRRPRKRL